MAEVLVQEIQEYQNKVYNNIGNLQNSYNQGSDSDSSQHNLGERNIQDVLQDKQNKYNTDENQKSDKEENGKNFNSEKYSYEKKCLLPPLNPNSQLQKLKNQNKKKMNETNNNFCRCEQLKQQQQFCNLQNKENIRNLSGKRNGLKQIAYKNLVNNNNNNNQNQGEYKISKKQKCQVQDDFVMGADNINNILPVKIGSLQIKKMNWKDLGGKIPENSPYKAHIYWNISYNYDVQIIPTVGMQKMQYKVLVKTWVSISNKSWHKMKVDHLLNHEQGHYLLGCLCALEFEKQCTEKSFSSNYRQEVNKLFNEILQKWLKIEIDYDEKTNHRLNFDIQEEWDKFILEEVQQKHQYFVSLQNQSLHQQRQNYQNERQKSLHSLQKNSVEKRRNSYSRKR
ncbi:hypothetical protein PPERSA_02256 [Pseudocohnilembus persalinus]|uniref:Uncharacterized protein n=1 Tax=Pseudocohnilembus persalinus TaxID=266149 RepID=A0A0V0QKJ4_PSEPJ|nr:hypothetical protein PPERSA_02256 [Pseudocohnilembus persalinus]|eukprot:KRX02766.1 hypothetical protein PPERSA_02256 [Pseudocohnilembus persalinus]